MVYNSIDNVWYGTNAQRVATDINTLPNTSKVYEVDTKLAYIAYGGAWYAL